MTSWEKMRHRTVSVSLRKLQDIKTLIAAKWISNGVSAITSSTMIWAEPQIFVCSNNRILEESV
jgi:hypothetical protein